jgi:hypothetical protein
MDCWEQLANYLIEKINSGRFPEMIKGEEEAQNAPEGKTA